MSNKKVLSVEEVKKEGEKTMYVVISPEEPLTLEELIQVGEQIVRGATIFKQAKETSSALNKITRDVKEKTNKAP